jgi:hypothetical protein
MTFLRRVARVCEASYALLAAILWSALPFPPGEGLRFTSAAFATVAVTSALIAWRLGRPSLSTWRAALVLAALCIVSHGTALAEGGLQGREVLAVAAGLQGVVFLIALVSHYAARVALSEPRPAA